MQTTTTFGSELSYANLKSNKEYLQLIVNKFKAMHEGSLMESKDSDLVDSNLQFDQYHQEMLSFLGE